VVVAGKAAGATAAADRLGDIVAVFLANLFR